MDDDAPVLPDTGDAFMAPRYRHVLKAVEGRPWALHPPVLAYIAELAHFRAAGGRLAADEIAERLAAAKDANGPRAGAGQQGAVAIIPVYGVLAKRMSLMAEMSGGTSYDELESAIAEAVNDPEVGSVVLDIDSPGGEVDGLPEFASFLRAARDRKPVIAQVNSLAASAAYWIAAQASEIVVTPSGEVGSIGVYTAHQDVSGAMDKAGVRTTLISAGKYKVEGNPYEPLGEDALGAIQDHVDEFYGMFVNDVARGRGVTADVVLSEYGEGRTLLAKAAKAAGMVDRIDTLGETVRRQIGAKRTGGRVGGPIEVAGESGCDLVVPAPLMPAAAAASSKPDRAWNASVAKRTRSRK